MAKKFFSAYEAAEFASKITDEWKSENDEIMNVNDLLSYMSIADEEKEIDIDNEDFYYVVTDDGSIGVTNNGEKTIFWVATPTKEVKVNLDDLEQKYCEGCGKILNKGAKFCSGCGKKIENKEEIICKKCGAKLNEEDDFCYSCGASVAKSKNQEAKTTSRSERTCGRVGYSEVIDDANFIEAVKKYKKSHRGCSIIFIGAPLVILSIVGAFNDSLGFVYGAFFGAVISLIFLVIYFLASFKEKVAKSWDGKVIDKYEKKVRVVVRHESDRDYSWRTHFFTIVRRDDGKKEKIEERNPLTYSYFKVGDKIRYHGKLGLIYPYEKYDKSKDEFVICAFCTYQAPIVDKECPKCHNPLLK